MFSCRGDNFVSCLLTQGCKTQTADFDVSAVSESLVVGMNATQTFGNRRLDKIAPIVRWCLQLAVSNAALIHIKSSFARRIRGSLLSKHFAFGDATVQDQVIVF